MNLTCSHEFINVQQLCSAFKKRSLYHIIVVLPVVFKLTFEFILPPIKAEEKMFFRIGYW